MEKKENVTSSELKYAQWNPAFTSLQKDIDQIKTINKVIRKETTLIDEFFSYIIALFNSHTFAIEDSDEISKKLDSIESKIYDKRYLRDLADKSINKTNIMLYQHKIIKDLENIFRLIVNNLSKNGLIPKIDKITIKDKGKALYN